MDTTENEDFPDTLTGFGYEFADGKLQSISTGEPFQFAVRDGDHHYNQKHYEAVGELVTEEVYKLLESECDLKKSPVPVDAEENEPNTFVFMSDDALDNPEKLLVLIHGSGVVRAGQWARRLIINDSVESGTQIPFIKRAKKEGYGVLVMNTNDNTREVNGKTVSIKESSKPENHAIYVWKKYVRKAKAKHIALIAHSFGGCVTTALYQEEKEDFVKRVFAVAMTDSVHFINKPKAFQELVRMSCNWVSSLKPLDTVLSSFPGDIRRVSSGVNVHEQTSWSSFQSVFKFLQRRYEAATNVGLAAAATAARGAEEDDEGTLERNMSFEEPAASAADDGVSKVHDLSDSDEEGEEENGQDVVMEDAADGGLKKEKEKTDD